MPISRSASLALALVASALVTPAILAQQQRQGDGPPSGQQAPSPDQFVDRMMENDVNGDGKLSREEVPGRFAEQMFTTGDTDKEGFLTREELGAFFTSRGPGLGRPQPGPGGAGAPPDTLERFMRQAGQGLRALRRSSLDAQTQADDLVHISVIEASLVGAKTKIDPEHMAPQAKEKYGDDKVAYTRAMRLAINKAIRAALELEEAVLESDTTASKAALEKLLAAQKAGHDQFQEEEEPPRRGQPPAGRENRGGGAGGGDDDGGL